MLFMLTLFFTIQVPMTSLGCFLNLVGFLRYDMGRLSDVVV